jgi:hypothetical protein
MSRRKSNSVKTTTPTSSHVPTQVEGSTKLVHAKRTGGKLAGAPRSISAIRPIPRRGLSRIEAAIYVGVSLTKFDELVRTGRMPDPKRIDGRKVWDVRGLDLAFDELPSEDNSWDDV